MNYKWKISTELKKCTNKSKQNFFRYIKKQKIHLEITESGIVILFFKYVNSIVKRLLYVQHQYISKLLMEAKFNFALIDSIHIIRRENSQY